MDDSKEISKIILCKVIEGLMLCVTKGIIWFRYEEKEGVTESCVICNKILANGDMCRISDCTHNFHNKCIVSYCNIVEEKCPICKTEVRDRLAPLPTNKEEVKKYKRMIRWMEFNEYNNYHHLLRKFPTDDIELMEALRFLRIVSEKDKSPL